MEETGTSKLYLGSNSTVLLYDGTVKLVSDLKNGDKIMGEKNHDPVEVLDVTISNENVPMYEITPKCKGQAIWTCSGQQQIAIKMTGKPHLSSNEKEHRFRARYWRLDPISNKVKQAQATSHYYGKKYNRSETEAEMLAKKDMEDFGDTSFIWYVALPEFLTHANYIRNLSNMYKPNEIVFDSATPSQLVQVLTSILGRLPTNEQIKAAAWLLGLWLADGNTDNAIITVGLHEEWNELGPELYEVAELLDSNLIVKRRERAYGISFRSIHPKQFSPLSVLIRSLNMLYNKHIPQSILHDDKDLVRLPFLAGLLDGDGDLNMRDKEYSITQKKKLIIEECSFLAKSLGFCVGGIGELWKSCQTKQPKKQYWRIHITGDRIDTIPCKISWKQYPDPEHRNRHPRTDQNRWGFIVEELQPMPCNIVTLKSHSKTILLGDMSVVCSC